jgi:heat shock protein HslJ
VAAVMGEPLSHEALAGREWILTHLDIELPVPEQIEITVRFEEGRIAGSSGCNTYFAELTERSPGVIEIGPAGTTRMACPDKIMLFELGYLERLGQISRYGFWMGKLALTWEASDGFGSFLFAPRPPSEPAGETG